MCSFAVCISHVFDSIMVVSAQTRRVMLILVCDLKAAQMTELDYNAAEVTKNICCERWWRRRSQYINQRVQVVHLGCQNLGQGQVDRKA